MIFFRHYRESLESQFWSIFSAWCLLMFLHTITVLPFLYWPQVTMSVLTVWQASSLYLGGGIVGDYIIFLIACCLQSDLRVVKVTAKAKISFCLRRNVLTTNSILERLFSGVDRFESWHDQLEFSAAEWDLQIPVTVLAAYLAGDFPLTVSLLDTGSEKKKGVRLLGYSGEQENK